MSRLDSVPAASLSKCNAPTLNKPTHNVKLTLEPITSIFDYVELQLHPIVVGHQLPKAWTPIVSVKGVHHKSFLYTVVVYHSAGRRLQPVCN